MKSKLAYLFFFLMAVGSLLYLFKPKQSEVSEDKESIARLVSYTDEVKFKSHSQSFWDDASKEQKLYEGDYIFTYGKSTAKVAYQNGVILNLKDNTLFKIEDMGDGIDIESGSIELELKGLKEIKIRKNDQVIKISGTDSVISLSNDDDELSINTISGSANVAYEDKDGKNLKNLQVNKGETSLLSSAKKAKVAKVEKKPVVEKGEKLVTTKIEKVDPQVAIQEEIKKEKLKLYIPFDKSILEVLDKNSYLDFYWEKGDYEEYHFELANDFEFEDIVVSKIVKENKISLNLNLVELKKYYWRVSTSKIQSFTLKRPARYAFPKVDLNRTFSQIKVEGYSDGSAKYKIDWPTLQNATSYSVDLYEAENPEKVIKTILTADSYCFIVGKYQKDLLFTITSIDKFGVKGLASQKYRISK